MGACHSPGASAFRGRGSGDYRYDQAILCDSRIPAEDYRSLIAKVDGPDPDDNAHMAAAVAGQVEVVVTWNGKDFDCGFMRSHVVTVMNPDAYLCSLLEEFPSEVAATITRLAAGKRRPPLAPADIVDALQRAGVSQFASRVRASLH